MTASHSSPDVRRSIAIEMQNGVLRCALPDDLVGNSGVVWTLHRGDFNERRASEPVVAGSTCDFELPDMTTGYAVRAEVDGVLHQSEWIQHFGTETVRSFEDWRLDWLAQGHEAPAEIPLFRYEEPFDNIAFVCHDAESQVEQLTSFASNNGLAVEHHSGVHWQNLTVVSGCGSEVDADGNRYVFSGITRDSERLIFGADDAVEHVSSIESIRDSIGEFHLLSWDDRRISFSHDYIGQGHLFYYATETMFAAANGLHLLALVLRELGVALTLDVPVVKSKFFSTSYAFEFQHGPRTDFAEIRRVPVFESLEIDSRGLRSTKTQLWSDDSDGQFSEELYESLLAQAASDIVDNVRIALDHPRFQNVVVELSAGLDSRIVYSALTRLPRSQKVRISTRKSPEERTAAAINNLYRYPWDDLPRVYSHRKSTRRTELPDTSHSVFMDGYYIESMFKPRENFEEEALLLTGHGGEAFSRVMSIDGYFARNFNGRFPDKYENVEGVLQDLLRYIGNHQVWFAAGREFFADILSGSLEESPSEDFAKRFADIYVSQRSPFVSGSVFRGAMSAPQWRPMHSRALFRLRSLWFQQQQDFRLQFDLIRSLNPLVSEVPYGKDVELARQREFEAFRAPFSIAEPIQYDEDTQSLVEARSAASARSSWLPSREAFNSTRSKIRRYEESADSFLDPLGHILDLAPELQDMGLPVYSYVERVVNRENPRAFSKRHNIRNKLHILLQEVLLTSRGGSSRC